MNEQPQPQPGDVQIEIQDLIARFGGEIGQVRGQAVMDKAISDAKEAQWLRERDELQKVIVKLTSRVTELEAQVEEQMAAASLPQIAEEGNPSPGKPAKKRADG